MSQGRTSGRRRQAPFGSNLGFGNASQQGVDNSLAGLGTAFPSPVSTIGNPGTLNPLDPIVAQSNPESFLGNPEILIDPNISTIGNPGTISGTDPIFDTGGLGVEQILGQFSGSGAFPGQGLRQRRVRGRSGVRGGK